MRRIQISILLLCVLAAVPSLAQEGASFSNSGAFDTTAFHAGVPNTGACNTGACNTGACNTGAGYYGGLGFGGRQLYPFDQQDPWLHGHYQRVPSYGGYSSFRPYNYRHVASQSQIAASLGVSAGMPYSQQFWNRYREGYLNENQHFESSERGGTSQPGDVPSLQQPITYSAAGFPQTQRLVRMPIPAHSGPAAPASPAPPVHVYPSGLLNR